MLPIFAVHEDLRLHRGADALRADEKPSVQPGQDAGLIRSHGFRLMGFNS